MHSAFLKMVKQKRDELNKFLCRCLESNRPFINSSNNIWSYQCHMKAFLVKLIHRKEYVRDRNGTSQQLYCWCSSGDAVEGCEQIQLNSTMVGGDCCFCCSWSIGGFLFASLRLEIILVWYRLTVVLFESGGIHVSRISITLHLSWLNLLWIAYLNWLRV